MSEVRSALERVRDRQVPPGDPFDRLVRYRARKQMRQRLAAGILALVVGTAGLGLAVRTFRAGDRPAATPSPSATATPSPSGTGTPSPSVTFDPREVTTFRIGPTGQVNAIVAAVGSVWVTGYGIDGGGGTDRAVLLRIDPGTNEVIDTIPVETAPSWETGGGGLAFADGSIWITGGGHVPGEGSQALLTRVDPASDRVIATIGLGGRFGADVAVNAQGVWVGIFTDGKAEVVHVDPSTNQVVGRIELPSEYVRRVVALDGSVVLEELEWANGDGPCGFFTAVDPVTEAIVAREPVADPCGLSTLKVWNGQIWATIEGGFGPIDPVTFGPVADVLAFEGHHSPRGFLVPDDTGIWYAAYPGGNGNGSDLLTRIDPATGKIVTYFPLDHGAISAVALDGSIWTLNYDGTMTRIDLRPQPVPGGSQGSSATGLG
jgi:hypothetical protein